VRPHPAPPISRRLSHQLWANAAGSSWICCCCCCCPVLLHRLPCQQPLQPAQKTRGTTNRRLIAGLAPAKLLQTRACYFSASRCSGCASTLRATGRQLGRGLLGSASRPCCPASCTWGPRGLAAKQARAAASCRRRCSRSISRPLLVSTAGPTSRPHVRRPPPPPARDPRRLPTACAMDGMPMPPPGGGGLAPIRPPGGGGLAPIRPGSGLAPLSGSGQLPSLLLGLAGWPLARSLVRSLAR
jgi:hypothetical protein